jgi:hypothetical protein
MGGGILQPSDPWNSPEYKDLLKPQTKAQKEEEKKEAKKSSNQPEQDNSPHHPGDGVTKSGYYATVTREDLKAVVRYAVQQDGGAIQSMVEEGRAVLLKPGVRVHIEESPFLSGEVKCRRIGTTFSFWTVSEAISEY